jgi:hypothetical protein
LGRAQAARVARRPPSWPRVAERELHRGHSQAAWPGGAAPSAQARRTADAAVCCVRSPERCVVRRLQRVVFHKDVSACTAARARRAVAQANSRTHPVAEAQRFAPRVQRERTGDLRIAAAPAAPAPASAPATFASRPHRQPPRPRAHRRPSRRGRAGDLRAATAPATSAPRPHRQARRRGRTGDLGAAAAPATSAPRLRRRPSRPDSAGPQTGALASTHMRSRPPRQTDLRARTIAHTRCSRPQSPDQAQRCVRHTIGCCEQPPPRIAGRPIEPPPARAAHSPSPPVTDFHDRWQCPAPSPQSAVTDRPPPPGREHCSFHLRSGVAPPPGPAPTC